MTLGTAVLLLVAVVIGIVLSYRFLRESKEIRIACIVLLSLIALALVGYIGLTTFFIDAVQSQPPIQ